jgi:asparagine synthase (glutamine-hydrolysing)
MSLNKMCGILAVLCNSLPKQLQQILLSGKYLSTRGPDSCLSIVKSNGIYIFHRLSINDTSSDGNQPMTSGEILMMCNGEIYNHLELEKEFDLKCKSKSDCEVILRLYEKIGFEETVKRLYGVFAIVLVDGNNVYMARDRIGVRPLYFGLTEEKYLAVSSVPNTLVEFCTMVTAFPPGIIAVHDKSAKALGDGKLQVMKYLYHDRVDLAPTRLDDGTQALHDSLVNAVKLRLMSDRPMGCLLSGGLDSSLVTSILVKFLGGKNVRTYSIGMEGSTDLYYARKVADALGTEHHEVLFTPQEGFAVIPEVIRTLASYDITTIRASVGMYLIAKYISQKSQDKVIFSGEGSDEVLEGYLYFHNAPTPQAGEEESLRLIRNLHLYDVLRADRCISVHGLEPRVPFLDRKFVDTTLALSASQKKPQHGFEKYVLRKAFQGYLPDEVLWRRKEGFSDGVSSVKKSWYHQIQEMVEPLIPDYMFNKAFPSKEAMYYKMIFDNIFPRYSNFRVEYWMPKWTDSKDPSGRLIQVYDEKSVETN